MRIAQIAPLIEAVPPRLYGGTERVVSFLTEELVRLAQDVTLFATGESETKAQLVAVCPRALRLDGTIRDANACLFSMLEQVFRRKDDFDVLHFHLDYWPLSLFSRQATPFLSTLHGRLDLPEIWPIYQAYHKAPLVSVSHAQRRHMQWASWAGTVYHGIPENLLRPVEQQPTYLAFLGRIAPEKRVDRAIEIATQCGLPLKIAAKVDPVDRLYYEECVRPLLVPPHVEYLGEISDSEKAQFLSGAMCLLFTGDWPEPFGLAMIEAMACGTPIIAYGNGAVPEVIEEGHTGFIVKGLEDAVEAVWRVPALSRKCCRDIFEQRFTATRMASDYMKLYEQLIKRSQETQRRACRRECSPTERQS
jgi:glycosyltransferase involved in cell wall biosynthesis